MIKNRIITLIDIYIVAFLVIHNLEPKLELRNGKVFFLYEATEQIYRLMNDFNSDVKVPITSYVSAVKTLRARMFGAKAQDIAATEVRKGVLNNGGD